MSLIVGVAVAGLAGLPLWLAVIGAAGLASITYREQQKLRARFSAIGATDVLTTAHLASLANAGVAAAASWGVGALLRLLLIAIL